MKRSEINATIKKMEALLDECRFKLPPYLYFTPEEWADKNHEYDEIRECELGWDVTDYGEGKFDTLGLALITIRNGNIHNTKYNKPYAEKIMMCDSGQVSRCIITSTKWKTSSTVVEMILYSLSTMQTRQKYTAQKTAERFLKKISRMTF